MILWPQKSLALVEGESSVSALGMKRKSSDLWGVCIGLKQSSSKPSLLGFPEFKRKMVGINLKLLFFALKSLANFSLYLLHRAIIPSASKANGVVHVANVRSWNEMIWSLLGNPEIILPIPLLKLKLSIWPCGRTWYWRQPGGANQSEIKILGVREILWLIWSLRSATLLALDCPNGH